MIELPEGRDFVLEAAWFWSGEGDPVQNVAIEVADGIIADVRSIRTTQSRLAVIPPLVNAHTHLELSDVREPFAPGATFPDWIRKVIRHRSDREVEADALKIGLTELAANGTIFAADTLPIGQVASYESAVSVMSFVEYIGLTEERVAEAANHAGTDLPENAGISPHAPYSVHPDLLDQLITVSVEQKRPVMMHLAETREEIELLTSGTGPFAEMLKSFGIWNDSLFPRLTLCDYIDRLATAPSAIIAHGNYFGAREIELVAANPQLTVAYCPRTHHHFGHSKHPWRALLEAGANVALGTDSRASNPDLSVWNEAKFLSQRSDISPELLLSLITTNGRVAIHGLNQGLGIGNSASFTVLQSQAAEDDFVASLFKRYEPVVGCRMGLWTME